MATIDPSARIEAGAIIADSATIGPFCVVGPNVTIGEDCRLVSHVSVSGNTTIGPRTVVYPFASLGKPPQSTAYHGEPTKLVIGADCDIRESVTMNIGTAQGRGITTVGDHCFLMANSHVGHDCIVGNNATFANCATLGGHCVIGDWVFIGGLAAVHQFTRIGESAMVAGVTGVRSDVIPYGLVIGAIGRLGGINVVGMRRRKFSRTALHAVRSAYLTLFDRDVGTLDQRIAAVDDRYGQTAPVDKILAFVREDRDRALCWPGDHHQD